MVQRKYKYEAEFTSNRTVYNRAIKRSRENDGDISCSYCPYHKNENVARCIWGGRHQTWKKHRKTQYKPINM
jgi:hypothetical protein